MNGRIAELAQRRERLTARCASERRQLRELSVDVVSRLSTADRLLGAASFVLKNPLAWLAAAAGAAVVGPWRLARWATQALLVFKIGARVRHWFG